MDHLCGVHYCCERCQLSALWAHLVSAADVVASDVVDDSCTGSIGNFRNSTDLIPRTHIHGSLSDECIAGGSCARARGWTGKRRAVSGSWYYAGDRYGHLAGRRGVDLYQREKFQTQCVGRKIVGG